MPGVVHLVEVVVVPRGGLLGPRPQGLQLGVQDVQQLLDEADRRTDVSGLDGTSGQVDQLSGDVGGVLAALDLHEGSDTNINTDIDTNTAFTADWTRTPLCLHGPATSATDFLSFLLFFCCIVSEV